jgi:hypothetical protein
MFNGLAEELVIEDEAIDNELVSSSSDNRGDTVVKSLALLLLNIIDSLFSLFLLGDVGNGTEILTESFSLFRLLLISLLLIVFLGEVTLVVFKGVVVLGLVVVLDDLIGFLSRSRKFAELFVFEISGFVDGDDVSLDDKDDDENFFNFSLIELATLILEDGFCVFDSSFVFDLFVVVVDFNLILLLLNDIIS